MAEETVIFQCSNIGIATITPVHVRHKDGQYEARAGVAILGVTNMTDEQMEKQGRDPFKDDWHDNTISGTGDTEDRAIINMKENAKKMADSLWW